MISLPAHVTYTCVACDAKIRARGWSVIDTVERSELVNYLGDDAWWVRTCAVCEEPAVRVTPMLVLRLNPVAPLVLGVPDDAFHADPPSMPAATPLLDRTHAEIDARGLDIPGPVLLTPFVVVARAAARNVSQDVANPELAVAELSAQHLDVGDMYRVFLEDVVDAHRDRRIGQGLTALMAARSATDLRAAVERFPGLRLDEARDRLAEWAEAEHDSGEEALVAQSQLALLDAALGGDFEAAWAAHELTLHQLWDAHVGPRLKQLYAESDRLSGTDWIGAARVGEELRALAISMGRPDVELAGSMRTATALWEARGAGRGARIERTIVLLERADELMRADPALAPEYGRASCLMQLGVAFSARFEGDPAGNHARAIHTLGEALSLVPDEPGRLWAMIHTNLGLSLLESVNARPADVLANAGIDPNQVIDEAIEHYEEALRWRTMERDPLDFAYTQLNLGLAYARRNGPDWPSDRWTAIDHYDAARRGFEAAGRTDHAASARFNTANLRAALAGIPEIDPETASRLRRDAEAEFRQALEVQPADQAGEERGRTLMQFAVLVERTGRHDEARAARQEALRVLPPEDLRNRIDAASSLAWMYEQGGEWAAAADTRELAALAASALTSARAVSEGRLDGLYSTLNVYRYAAYALARARRPERAVEILEAGRGREIAEWIADDVLELAQLVSLDPELADRYRLLREQLQAAERSIRRGTRVNVAAIAPVAEELVKTTTAVRELAGMERFQAPATFQEIAATTPDGEALVYPVTSPHGSVLLIVRGTARPHVDVIELAHLSSMDVLARLYTVDELTGERTGYLVEQAEASDGLDARIHELEDLLGPSMLEPLDDRLRALGVQIACLIPVGLLGWVPLHALSWGRGDRRVCLLDGVEVVYAPSALARRVCRVRAERRGGVDIALVVGNPLPHPCPLAGAESEAHMVSATLPARETRLLVGREATKTRVLDGVQGADHVHLACHGAAATGARNLDARVEMAHAEPVTGVDLLELDGFAPRLVVASACETGMIAGYEEADESLSLSTAFIGAGAAGVIASLWAVNDFATALLMSRFYELHVAGIAPATALREGQLWLRDLTADAEEEYVNSREALRAHRDDFARRHGAPRASSPRRWAEPSMWAAFTLTGA